MQQRNGRKSWTLITGLDERFDPKKILRQMQKTFSCNGTVVEDSEHGCVIQLQGDQRELVVQFLKEQAICTGDEIRMHGT